MIARSSLHKRTPLQLFVTLVKPQNVVVVDVLSQHYGLARTVPPYTYRGHKPVKRSVGQSNVLRQSGGRVHFKNQIEVNFSRRKSSEGVEALVK